MCEYGVLGHAYMLALVQPTQLLMPCSAAGFLWPSQALLEGSLHCLPSGTLLRDGVLLVGSSPLVWTSCSDVVSWVSPLWDASLCTDKHASLMCSWSARPSVTQWRR